MKSYYRVILGAKSAFAKECYDGSFIGANYDINQDLTNELPDYWRDFNPKFRDNWLKEHPDKTKVAAGLAVQVARLGSAVRSADMAYVGPVGLAAVEKVKSAPPQTRLPGLARPGALGDGTSKLKVGRRWPASPGSEIESGPGTLAHNYTTHGALQHDDTVPLWATLSDSSSAVFE
jgi:hypothetical protein